MNVRYSLNGVYTPRLLTVIRFPNFSTIWQFPLHYSPVIKWLTPLLMNHIQLSEDSQVFLDKLNKKNRSVVIIEKII